MSSTMMDRSRQLAGERKRRRRWGLVTAAAACAILAAGVWTFMLSGRALEEQPVCGIEEHQHSEACYSRELVCGLEETAGHQHTDACYESVPVLVCGQEERAGHIHTDDCIGFGEPVLVCGLPEDENHVHSESCYEAQPMVVCGLEEDAGHVHSDACYAFEQELLCGQEEQAPHTHSDACYREVLTCGLPEHVHDAACYEEASVLPDTNADRETAEQWERAFDELQLTGNWAADLVTVANTQLGYGESKVNYIVDPLGIQRGYTRYGQWHGLFDAALYAEKPEEAHFDLDPDACIYMDWDALFVSFCLNYAGISHEAMPYETDAAQWARLLATEEWNRYVPANGEYAPKMGDLVFFDNDRNGIVDHVGIVAKVDESVHEPQPEAAEGEGPVVDRVLTVVCLSQNPSEREVAEALAVQPEAVIDVTRLVKAETVDLTDDEVSSRVAGYGMLPQNPEQPPAPETPADPSEIPVPETPIGPDPNADVETPEDWEASLEGVGGTGDLRADVVAVAQSQLGYTESALNYIENEDGTVRNGYTRYGQWYGDPYGDWCAMFASFCLTYGGVQDYPLDASCPNWVASLQESGKYQEAASDYIPQPGDLVFYDIDQDGVADHMGIVSDISTVVEPVAVEDAAEAADAIEAQADFLAVDDGLPIAEEEAPEVADEAPAEEAADQPQPEALPEDQAQVAPEPARTVRLVSMVAIEGNAADAVNSVTYDAADPSIMGYGTLAEKTGFTINGRDVPSTYTWNYADGLMSMNVTFTGDAVVDDGGQLASCEPVLDVEIGSPEDAQAIVEEATQKAAGSEEAAGEIPALEATEPAVSNVIDADGVGAPDQAPAADEAAASLTEGDLPVVSGSESLTKEDAEEVHPLMTFTLHLMAGDEEIDLSQCAMTGEISVSREILALPATLDAEGNETEQEVSSFKLFTEEGELGATSLDETSGEDVTVPIKDDTVHVIAGTATTTSNPTYTIQHYFNFPQVVTGSGDITLPFINASSSDPNTTKDENIGKGGKLPTNGVIPNTFNVPLVSDGQGAYRLETQLKLLPLFIDEETTYRKKPQINYMCRLYNNKDSYNRNYDLVQIWVYQPKDGVTPENIKNSKNASDFIVYDLEVGENGRHDPGQVRFTNNPANKHVTKIENGKPVPAAHTEAWPFTYTILIQEGTVVRFVFDTTSDRDTTRDANFFDYDITSGVIYSDYKDEVLSGESPTSSQAKTDNTWYAETKEQGINNSDNYKGYKETDAKYAFGNNNTGTGLGKVKWNNQQLNMNNETRLGGGGGYSGCTFGLVESLTYGTAGLPVPVWSKDVCAPDIFSSASVTGKTVYNKGQYGLNFLRDGGTYTLAQVVGSPNPTMISDLSTLIRTFDDDIWDGTHKVIYSNEFWPLTGSPSDGTDGHDLKFGSEKDKAKRIYVGDGSGTFPTVDAANQNRDYDQDAYFGMSFTVDFTVRPGYCSPLAYWFYGDDDMWVFLDELELNEDGDYISTGNPKLVADIGGVHSSVGEYVNLWDYIPRIPYTDENGNENTSKTYRLTIFYTERGASGSTCYMRFTVPLTTITQEPVERTEALLFEKVLLDENGNVRPYEPTDDTLFEFELTLTNQYDTSYEDAYDYAIYRRDTTPNHQTGEPVERGVITTPGEDGKYHFKLHGGEYIVIENLPDNTHYTIEETPKSGYVTYYQKGTHEHVGDQQVDTLESSVRYGHIAGQTPRIDAAVNNMVRFTNGPAVKTEVSPGDGETVVVGDEIIYEIEWGNDQGDTAEVVITDKLDKGLDFVAAAFGSKDEVDKEEEVQPGKIWWEYGKNGDGNSFTSVRGNSIEYDPESRTVKWTRKAESAQASGVVTLKVRVNKDALQEDGIVNNQATIKVGTNPEVTTNITKNPTWDPVKTETDPGANELVRIGEKVTYQITWKNYTFEDAEVVVRDPLDKGVTFDGTVNTATAWIKTGTDASGKPTYTQMKDISASYQPGPITDPKYPDTQFSGQLTWDLGEQPAGAEGYVQFDVTVNENAIVPTGGIWNWGYVKVGNRAEVETNHIWNPVPTYELPETGGPGTIGLYVAGGCIILCSIIALCVLRKSRQHKTRRG